MTTPPALLADAHWPDVANAAYDVAVLPWGATEPHNRHLPYATDNFQCDGVAAEAAARANARGGRVVVLPTVPFGVQTGQLDLPLAINLNPSTQAQVLRDVIDSVERAGIRKFVLFNGHGGNDFKQMLRELQPTTRVFLCALNWWQVMDGRAYFDEPGDHAGELETSVMMHLRPGLVRPLAEAGDGAEKKPTITGFRERWVWAQRPWTTVSADTGIGDPRASTAEKGARYVDAVADRIAQFLVELSQGDPSSMYA
ncbi:MAG: creatininase family protein [Gemmatimonadota bacterium]|nr:creatininase family protein [Gemmatimonadota bacterium]